MKQCTDCPFATSGPGLELRKSLRPGRWQGILFHVRLGRPFYCHHTTHEDGHSDGDYYEPNGQEQLCIGSINWIRGHQR